MTWCHWAADLALGLDALGPVDHQRVARAAVVRRDLLGPLERRVRPRGPSRHGSGYASLPPHLIEQRQLILDLVGDSPFKHDHLVERTGRDRLPRSSRCHRQIVEEERVVQLAHVPSIASTRRPMFVVSVAPRTLRTPPSDLRVELLLLARRALSQSWMSSGLRASLRPRGDHSHARSAVRASAHDTASHPSSNLPSYLSIHSCGTWCGACVAPVAK